MISAIFSSGPLNGKVVSLQDGTKEYYVAIAPEISMATFDPSLDPSAPIQIKKGSYIRTHHIHEERYVIFEYEGLNL